MWVRVDDIFWYPHVGSILPIVTWIFQHVAFSFSVGRVLWMNRQKFIIIDPGMKVWETTRTICPLLQVALQIQSKEVTKQTSQGGFQD